MEALRTHFKPEFLNRIDDTIIFHSLSVDQIKQIVEIQLGFLRHRLKEQHIEIALTDAAKDFLAQKGFDPVYGARPLKRSIQKHILDELAIKLLEGSFGEESSVIVDVSTDQQKLAFTSVAREAA